jgi:hypothetical protein
VIVLDALELHLAALLSAARIRGIESSKSFLAG